MAKTNTLLLSVITALNFICIAFAFDPLPRKDFCVANHTSPEGVNGLPCKDRANVTAEDFLFRGLAQPGNASIPITVLSVDATTVPGLNTLGISMAHFDIVRGGFVPPHYHPRATELLYVFKGLVEAGFVESGPSPRHFSTFLKKGDVFVFPVGLLHYFRNVGKTNCIVMGVFNSQDPGISEVTGGVFGAEPPIDAEYLAKAYMLDQKTVERLETRF